MARRLAITTTPSVASQWHTRNDWTRLAIARSFNSVTVDDYRRRDRPSRHRHFRSTVIGASPFSLRPSLIFAQPTNRYCYNHQQLRHASWLPEALQSFSIWGGSGYVLKVFHDSLHMEYWACFAAMSVFVRVALFPLVLYGAQTASRFAKVVPEVQFILTLLNNDLKKLREQQAGWQTRAALMITNLRTMGGIYKLHKINPFSVFLSPLIQLPIFMYISVDMRKILNGLDPMLAQQLVDASVAWIPDLTEPDPWFGLPILAGVAMYANIEVAVGRQSLSGATAAKSNTAVVMKDIFQSAAVFMPCFTAQLPAGVQIYLVTSFLWTMGQSAMMRTEGFRQMAGLPSLLTPLPEASYAKHFIELNKMEQKARELRGDGPLLGVGVLAKGYQASFAGTNRRSTIQGSDNTNQSLRDAILPAGVRPEVPDIRPMIPFIHGISAPPSQLIEQKRVEERKKEQEQKDSSFSAQTAPDREYMPQFDDDVMEMANRGELPAKVQFVERDDKRSTSSSVSLKRFQKGTRTKKKPAAKR